MMVIEPLVLIHICTYLDQIKLLLLMGDLVVYKPLGHPSACLLTDTRYDRLVIVLFSENQARPCQLSL